MRYKLGDDHAAARQETLDCFCCFIIFLWLITRQATPRPSPLRMTTISPVIAPSTLDRRVEWPANVVRRSNDLFM